MPHRTGRRMGPRPIFLPHMTPPAAEAEHLKWYRVASDILEIPERYEQIEEDLAELEVADRQVWGSQIEFLMSCIATSVGLGNVWRFAFVAYKNGGGAFLIPYLIVLIFIGKPMYYLECCLGQFSSRNSVRVWSLAPGMRGVGYAQTICILYILSYYVAIVALCLHYLMMSFTSPLPWAACEPKWKNCVPSDPSLIGNRSRLNDSKSSAELYFIHTVLQQIDSIDDGIGVPIWYLVACLLVAWLIIFLIVIQGVKSSGKAAYFLALFPYVIMIILLVSTLILPGAGKGILFFITPQWEKLIQIDVWYAAVTQVFFSLSVGTGPIIMFSSYNSFRANVHRDSMIITTLDTFTSLLSGVTIFGILGNLAHMLNVEVVDVVGSGGTGLAFISYPDAIAKTFMPQVFAVLFFVMMVVLGIGSSVAFVSTINTVCLDGLPRVRSIYITVLNCFLGFLSGIVYLTPGGQYILQLVDYYGATFLALFCAICEIIGVIWVYGLENVCLDLEFMLRHKTSMYWRVCWGIITPAIMITVFLYSLLNYQPLMFGGNYYYPVVAEASGYCILFIGIICVPLFIYLTKRKEKVGTCRMKLNQIFLPKTTWGPRNRKLRQKWEDFKLDALQHQKSVTTSRVKHCCYSLTGAYRKGYDGPDDDDDSGIGMSKNNGKEESKTKDQKKAKVNSKTSDRNMGKDQIDKNQRKTSNQSKIKSNASEQSRLEDPNNLLLTRGADSNNPFQSSRPSQIRMSDPNRTSDQNSSQSPSSDQIRRSSESPLSVPNRTIDQIRRFSESHTLNQDRPSSRRLSSDRNRILEQIRTSFESPISDQIRMPPQNGNPDQNSRPPQSPNSDENGNKSNDETSSSNADSSNLDENQNNSKKKAAPSNADSRKSDENRNKSYDEAGPSNTDERRH